MIGWDEMMGWKIDVEPREGGVFGMRERNPSSEEVVNLFQG